MMKLIFPMLLILSSCGTMKKWALRSTTPLFQRSSDLTTHERNWDYFRESAPSNLKFTELLYLQDQKNTDLLGILAKGHAGYSYAVPETLLLQDELAGVEDSHWKEQAIAHYTRALDYGLDYLDKKDISRNDLLTLNEEKLKKKLKKEIDKEDAPALLYTAQSWGSLINLQKDNIALVSQVPRVKILFDHACKLDSKMDHGVCNIFEAQYQASRPRMLGGNPEKARELYEAAFKQYPQHLLIRVNYLQTMIIPAMDEEAYNEQADILRTEFTQWDNLNRDSLQNTSEYRHVPELNLYNAIAKKRFEIIEKYKSKIF